MVPARSVILVAVLAALAPALAGCLGATDSTIRVVAYVDVVNAEPGRATELAVFVNNTGAFRSEIDLAVERLPANWTLTAWPESGTLTVDGHAGAFAIFGVTPAPDAKHGAYGLRLRAGDGGADVVVNVRDLGEEPARRGVGVHVRTVGVYGNGTVFYSNMKEVRDNAAIPWHMLDPDAKDDANMEPLKVYVGGKRRTPPPEPYNASGYSPVIEGFDERLRTGNGGMRAGETLAVRIPKEKAYTLDGNEDHVLYGFDLNFVIEVVSVDLLPPPRDLACVPGSDVCIPPPG